MTGWWSRARGAVVSALALALCSLGVASCTPGSDDTTDESDDEALVLASADRSYHAVWLIDAEAVGADGPGFPFRYVETVDDSTGRYLVQSPNHVAVQSRDEVVFCAAIFHSSPYCAATERAENAPPVLSFPIQLVRGWGPTGLYDLASRREVAHVAAADPDAWDTRFDVVNDVRIECFAVVGETSAARTGFEVCFTDDDLHLVASVDLQGDLIYEIDLIDFRTALEPDDFETGLEEFVEAKPSLQDQLITLFPEVPAPRPTPTPDPLSDA